MLREDLLVLTAADADTALPTPEETRVRVSAVISLLLDRMLAHTVRGKGADMWDAVMEEARSRLKALTKGPASADKVASVSRCVHWLAQMVEHARGSRVEDYAPLLQLVADLARHEAFQAPPVAPATPAPALEEDEDERVTQMRTLSLTGQTVRMFAAIADAHGKVAGASLGFSTLEKSAASFGPLFTVPLPTEVLELCRRMLSNTYIATDASRVFGGHVMAACHRCLKDDAPSTATVVEALTVLGSLCSRMDPALFERALAAEGTQSRQPVPLLVKCRDSPTELMRLVPTRITDLVRRVEGGAVDVATLEALCGYLAVFPYSVNKWSACVTTCSAVYTGLGKALRGADDKTGLLALMEIASNTRIRAELVRSRVCLLLCSPALHWM